MVTQSPVADSHSPRASRHSTKPNHAKCLTPRRGSHKPAQGRATAGSAALGYGIPILIPALKGRNKPPGARPCVALSGLEPLSSPKPRAALRGSRRSALPWAGMSLPLRGVSDTVRRIQIDRFPTVSREPPTSDGGAKREVISQPHLISRAPAVSRHARSGTGDLTSPAHWSNVPAALKGQPQSSLGQSDQRERRPRFTNPDNYPALKGRNNSPVVQRCAALTGLQPFRASNPGKSDYRERRPGSRFPIEILALQGRNNPPEYNPVLSFQGLKPSRTSYMQGGATRL